MKIEISNHKILKLLYIITWIILMGLLVEAGGIICNSVFTLAFNNANGTSRFWGRADLSYLYAYDHGFFMVIALFMSIVALLKALMFYLLLRTLHKNKLDISRPFNPDTVRFALHISYIALAIGLFCGWGNKYAGWLAEKGIQMPAATGMGLDGGDVWLFMGITLLVIAQIFKKGIEIQTENDLTV